MVKSCFLGKNLINITNLLSAELAQRLIKAKINIIWQEKSSGKSAHYKLTSTVMLWLQTTREGSGTMNLGGSLTRQQENDKTLNESSPHLVNIGQMVEVIFISYLGIVLDIRVSRCFFPFLYPTPQPW